MTFFKQQNAPQLKICGITRPQDLAVCHDLGVKFIGFNFYKNSKRFIDPKDASGLWNSFIKNHPTSSLVPVLVSVDAEPLDLKEWVGLFPDNVILQMHGKETATQLSQCKTLIKRDIWKALPVESKSVRLVVKEFQSVARKILLDSPVTDPGGDVSGGSGTSFLWNEYADLISQDYIGVAGGVNPDNIIHLLNYNPSLIDVASGSESAPGIKDSVKIQRLVSSCRKAFE